MRRRLAFVVLVAITPACTLVALEDGIEIAECEPDAPSREGVSACAPLDVAAPVRTPGSGWRCGSDRLCFVGPLDADHDGVAAVAEGDAPADCDDTDYARTPGAIERCDGVDNDCNGVVDDVAFSAGAGNLAVTTRLELTSATAGVSRPSYVPLPTSHDLVVAFADQASASLAGDLTLGSAVAFTGSHAVARTVAMTTQPLSGFAASAALLDDGRIGFALRAAGVCGRIALGAVALPAATTGSTGIAAIDTGHLVAGLPDDVGADCDDTTLEARSPVLASNGAQVLALWTRQNGTDTCGAQPEADVLANGGLRVGDDIVPSTSSGQVVAITDDASPPALAHVSAAFGYLAIVPRAGSLQLRRITTAADGTPLVVSTLLDVPDVVAGESVLGDVALARGPAADGHQPVVVVFRSGACGAARIHALAFDLDLVAFTATASWASAVALDDGAAHGQRAPGVVYSAAPRGFFVSWPDRGTNIVMRGVTGEGALLYDAPVVVLAATDAASADAAPFGARVGLGAGVGDADEGLTLLVPYERTSGGAVSRVTLSCPP